MKKNNKGFTLVELLAVIVILALLMMIAIPSVTRYITQSRVKTITKTMDSYITAVVQEVNDGDYHFSDSTKVYAIPIECVSLEKGGTNPLGEWMQANDNYWAYVLVQYDNVNYNYKYGFTFKDSAGYGMYPTVSANIDENSNQVKTGYDDLTKPESGKAVEFVSSEKWNGFTITDEIELIVLEAASEGEEGNGETTCTLCQKGSNYESVEEEKTKVCFGEGTSIGSVITCGSESFYVIDSDGNNISMFTKYGIDLTSYKQSSTAESDRFVKRGTSGYWRNPNLLPQYGENYPAYIYDSNSNIYQYVEGYKNYLNEHLKLNVISAKLISREQLQKLGCGVEMYDSCSGAPSWVYTPGYWTGYTWTANEVSYVDWGANVHMDDYTYGWPVRPVITISKSSIKF